MSISGIIQRREREVQECVIVANIHITKDGTGILCASHSHKKKSSVLKSHACRKCVCVCPEQSKNKSPMCVVPDDLHSAPSFNLSLSLDGRHSCCSSIQSRARRVHAVCTFWTRLFLLQQLNDICGLDCLGRGSSTLAVATTFGS